jgi:threonyl-tRNA synthetase
MNKNIEHIRHSLAHLLAQAVLKKFPDAKLGIGPTIENGFYYDFLLPRNLAPEDLVFFEKEIKNNISKNLAFKGEKISANQAKDFFKNQPFKLELINEFIKEKKPLTIFKTINPKTKEVYFTDLCRGGHIKNTKEINPNAFKLTKIAGAYWKGDEKNPQLQRIYGIAFNTEEELKKHLELLENAEKCDHRNLAQKLNIFMISEDVGKGLPLWLPGGYKIRRLLENYIYELEEKDGYQYVLTPHLAKEDLYKKSGHLAHYKDDMYAPINIDENFYYLKPMNCPHHHMIYKSEQRSYKDLPLRLAEFGTVYRYERSGVLTGLIRVRGFTQNDSHIYTDEKNLSDEIIKVLKLHQKVFKDLKIKDYWYRLSLPDFKNKEKFGDIKNKKMWERGSKILEAALKKLKLKYVKAIGEASFYGPKIDIQIKNILGNEDTISTAQVDYYSAKKFDLNYIDEEGKEKPIIVIHRAILGSFERFIAFLLEKTCGYLPLWLAPVQVEILTVSKKTVKYANKILNELKKENIRVKLNDKDETIGKKIREAEIKHIPYILIIGEKEKQNNYISIRSPQGYKQKNPKVFYDNQMSLSAFISKIKKEIEEKI